MEFVKPDKPDATVSVSGLPFIDVPALARKDYQMSFFTYREGQYQTKVGPPPASETLSEILVPAWLVFQVTFQNATSGEYLFYLVTFESLPAGPLSTVELVATVREKVSGSVTVENPLSSATCLTLECKCPEISAPAEHTLPGESKVGFTPVPPRALRTPRAAGFPPVAETREGSRATLDGLNALVKVKPSLSHL